MSNHGKNMKLFTSYWGDKNTFKLMPIVEECPFTEVIYDRSTSLLVVISKLKYQKFQMVNRLDDDGNPIQAKKPKMNNKPWKEQRTTLEVLQEYYITEKEEQVEFIKEFAVNAESYDYERFMRDLDEENKAVFVPEQPGLVDEKGLPLENKVGKGPAPTAGKKPTKK